MSIDEKAKESIDVIEAALVELKDIENKAFLTDDFRLGKQKIEFWKNRTVDEIYKKLNPQWSEKFQKIRQTSWGVYPRQNFRNLIKMHRDFLIVLKEELDEHPENVLSISSGSDVVIPVVGTTPPTKNVFIVHGHDETNLLKLEKLIKNRFKLTPLIMKDEPGQSRTLIEKLEHLGKDTSYSFVIYTPDDIIELEDNRYAQARPNVIFELGWFFGRLGRQNVCILYQKGTKIHTDLEGIHRIEFNESVEEKILDIEKELKAAGLISGD